MLFAGIWQCYFTSFRHEIITKFFTLTHILFNVKCLEGMDLKIMLVLALVF